MVVEKKRGGNSSPANFLKLTATLSGVALGVVSCFSWYDPVPVHADAGEFAGAVDYIIALEGEEAGALSTPGGGYVSGALIALYLCTRTPISTGSTVDASTVAFTSGTYYNGNTLKRGALVCTSGSFAGVDGYDFAFSEDFDLYITGSGVSTGFIGTASDSGTWRYYRYLFSPTFSGSDNLSVIISNRKSSSGCLSGSYNCTWGSYYMGVSLSITGSSPQLSGTSLSSYIAGGDFNGGSSRPAILGNTVYSRLPSGDLDLADPMPYYNTVLRPYIVENYPEYIYLLPQVPESSSEYATDDIVPGIPKDWTIINPELPTSPHLDLTIPDGDFQAIDPGDTFTGFASGVGFWWSMVNEFLNTFHIKTLALALLAVAVAIFALYKIGG